MRPHHGALTLFVDGKPVPAIFADIAAETTPERIAALASAGVHFYRVHTDLGWNGAGKFDFGDIEARVPALLQADSEARFLLDIDVDAPAWWRKAHPDECVAYCLPLQDGEAEEGEPPPASWASRRWLNEAGDGLARLLRYAGRQDWAGRLLGCQLSAGVHGEWRLPEAERRPDIGPHMRERFLHFALEKYRRNAGLLRKAWDDPRADFTKISCPSARDRRHTDLGVFRDPVRSRRLLDYYECLFSAQTDAALHFCAIAKRATEGRALVGLAFATVFGTEGFAEDGHAFPQPVFDSEDVDFLANPGPTDGGATLRAAPGSLVLRGKFLFHIPQEGQPLSSAAILAQTHHAGLIIPATSAAEELRPLLTAGRRGLNAPGIARRRNSQVAVVLDLANNLTTQTRETGANRLNEALLTGQMRQLESLGAPFDVTLLSDLFHLRLPDYKVFLFLNLFYLSEAERRQIDARVKRSEKTAVWLWSPGVVAENGIDAENGRQACGLKLRLEKAETAWRVRIAEANDPLTWGMHVGATFGPDRPVAPAVTITDKTAVRLGANSANKTVYAVKRAADWTSIHCGAAPFPTALLKNVLRAAGCHLYTDCAPGDRLYAEAGSVALTTERGGNFRISLPGRADVFDLREGRPIAEGVTEFTVNLPPAAVGHYETRMRREREERR